jgi:hypothetical protein
VTQGRSDANRGERQTPHSKILSSSYYGLLGVHPSASAQEIRQAYRDLSKQYHPDTTALPAAIATSKFQELNEAYATLSNPERRLLYDRKIGYSRVPVVQPLPSLHQSQSAPRHSSSAYLDPIDRPLSPGELFALFILGLTFIACLVLAIAIGLTRGEEVFQPVAAQVAPPVAAVSVKALPEPVPISKSALQVLPPDVRPGRTGDSPSAIP